MNKRLLIASVLSFFVLIGFNYILPKSQRSAPAASKMEHGVDIRSGSAKSPQSGAKAAPSMMKPHSDIQKSSAANGLQEIIATVKTKRYTLKIDKLGRFASIVLSDEKYRGKDNKKLELIEPDRTPPLELRFADKSINTGAFKTPYSASSASLDASRGAVELTLTQKLSALRVSKRLKFYPDGHYDLKIDIDKKERYFVTTGHRPEADKSRYMIVRGALLRDANGIITTLEDKKVEESGKFEKINIVSSFDRYYAFLFYNFEKPFNVIVMSDKENDPLPFISVSGSMELHGYAGAKEWKLFEKLDPGLTDAIEFGWFTFLSKPFFKIMQTIYDFVGNWGWAIVLFTILVKLVLFPLSYKGMMSMQKLKDLAPKMKEIKEKYGKDPAKMNQQMMALYKKHGANPMGGCLPMLLQVPVFFSLYRVLLNADELQGAPWILWISDLSRQDPYFVLPILMGVSMFAQQHITPNTMTDPMQQKIFKWFPAIMTFFFLTFPSGLVLYWLTNNILSIAQQYYINHAYEKYKEKLRRVSVNKEAQE